MGIARFTRRVRQWLVELGADLPFRAAVARLASLTDLSVGAETIRAHTLRVGALLEQCQQKAITQVAATQETAESLESAPGTLVVQTDGVMVRFLDGWHEVKTGLVAGLVDSTLQAVSYVAAREHPDAFGPRLLTEAARRGALEVVHWTGRGLQEPVLRAVVVLGDGAPWIWRLAAEYFGERTEILDLFHAAQHLWSVAHALYGEGTAVADAWAHTQVHTLRDQGVRPVLATLRALLQHAEDVPATVLTEVGYFTRNQTRMAYPTYAAQGVPLGSGAVESACRHLVQLRLKRAGMRWSPAGARRVLHVRCHLASTRSLAALA